MFTELWGKKVGMTQVFVGETVVPVTALDVSSWIVVGFKTQENDGYRAVKVARLRKRYEGREFSLEWTKKLKKYFLFVREVSLQDQSEVAVAIGDAVAFHQQVKEGDLLDVGGTSKGLGTAGVVRAHGFRGERGSHGETMGNAPGSMSFMRSQGRVIKGKRLPKRAGFDWCVVKNLPVIKVHGESLVLVKGAVPGKTGTLISLRKVSS